MLQSLGFSWNMATQMLRPLKYVTVILIKLIFEADFITYELKKSRHIFGEHTETLSGNDVHCCSRCQQ